MTTPAPETKYLASQLSSPVIFLNATVLSFNGSLGYGSQESTLTVELIEDCEQGQVFANGFQNDPSFIGSHVCFPEDSGGMAFSFCGIITNWTKNDGPSGLTYSVTLSDPRRILENVAIIVDTYSGYVADAKNVYPVYGAYEPPGDCSRFGDSGNINDRGMPYQKVIEKLNQWPGGLFVYAPTATSDANGIQVDLSTLPSGLPEYYRVNGPSISLLQLITDVCEATGHDFYVYSEHPNPTALPPVIRIQPIDLKQIPASFDWITNYGLNDTSIKVTDRSFGRELRVEKQKNLILGEKVHYFNMATDFLPFFGEDQNCNAVVAEPGGECGFSVLVNTAPLAASLRNPLVFSGGNNYYVYEIDLRCNYDLWLEMVLKGPQSDLSPYALMAKQWWLQATGEQPPEPLSAYSATAIGLEAGSEHKSNADRANNPGSASAQLTKPHIHEDMQKIFGYIQSLSNTYYGKQFLGKIYDNICYKQSSDIIGGNGNANQPGCINSEVVYSSVPTNDGAWIEPGGSLIGVGDPYLGFFRQEDGRVGPFALFSVNGTTPPPDGIGTPSTTPSPP